VLGRYVGEREPRWTCFSLSLRYKRPAPPASEAFNPFAHRFILGGRGRRRKYITLATLALRRPAHTGEAVIKTLHIEKAELRSSSRNSSFACHYKGPKPNQLGLLIQRVTKSPADPCTSGYRKATTLLQRPIGWKSAARESQGPSLPRPKPKGTSLHN
jgi:hypothetical protein